MSRWGAPFDTSRVDDHNDILRRGPGASLSGLSALLRSFWDPHVWRLGGASIWQGRRVRSSWKTIRKEGKKIMHTQPTSDPLAEIVSGHPVHQTCCCELVR